MGDKFLVFHGGSGIDNGDIKKAIEVPKGKERSAISFVKEFGEFRKWNEFFQYIANFLFFIYLALPLGQDHQNS